MRNIVLILCLFLSVQGCKWLDNLRGKKAQAPSPAPGTASQAAPAQRQTPVERAMADLESKYQFRSHLTSLPKLSAAEEVHFEKFKKFKILNPAERDQTMRKWAMDFPSSTLMQSSYAMYMLRNNRVKEAEEYLAKARKARPDDILLKLNVDAIKEMNASPNPEGKVSAQFRLRLKTSLVWAGMSGNLDKFYEETNSKMKTLPQEKWFQ